MHYPTRYHPGRFAHAQRRYFKTAVNRKEAVLGENFKSQKLLKKKFAI